MEHCVGCGHALGQGLFCTQCGRPCDRDDWRTGTAERPVVPPIVEPAPHRPLPPESAHSVPAPAPRLPSLPPPVVAPPPAARYPLYADEAVGLVGPGDVSAGSDRSPEPPTAPPPAPPQPSADPTYAAGTADPAGTAGPSGRRALPWVLGVAAVLVMALVGALLLLGPGDDAGDRAEDPAAATSPSATSDPTPAEPPRTEEPDGAPADPPRRRRPAQVTRSLTVEVPETAAPNQDVRGNLVRYEATNLIDGVPTTCWRMPGAATGEEIVLRLAEPTRVAQVGLINGYAKTSGDFDWYAGNRRVLAVEWVFDDGTTVAQSLKETRALQTRAIEPVRTETIRLRLVEVSAPGRGRAARDYTAISDVSVTGTPL